MKTERIVLSAERSVTLDLFLQEVGGEFRHIEKRPAVLVIPGGGYAMCSDREADPVALAYAKAGYQAFILRYSVGKDATWPQPLEDYVINFGEIILTEHEHLICFFKFPVHVADMSDRKPAGC